MRGADEGLCDPKQVALALCGDNGARTTVPDARFLG